MSRHPDADVTADRIPAAYAPFQPVLERLSEPLRRLLNGQLEQFEHLFPTLTAARSAPQGKFEGLGGLTPRGEVSHILQSELLLRTEAPLEFLRRLAESETLFLERQFTDRGAQWVYRVALSIGPAILGHGRIVALAALFFVARVARERGAEFHWCILPRADGPLWFDELSVGTVKRFLRAVSYQEADAGALQQAHDVWCQLEPHALEKRRIETVDWVIGAEQRHRTGRSRSASAVGATANAFSFLLLPPIPGAPRSVQIAVRRGAREQARAVILFPDDRMCVSALENPFASHVPGHAAGREVTPVPPLDGWEPRYLVVSGKLRLVRLQDGLLILEWERKAGIVRSYFMPVEPACDLVGVRVNEGLLSTVVRTGRAESDRLSLRRYQMFAQQDPACISARSKEVPTAQLFRNRNSFTIPPLSIDQAAEFYAVSGQAYRLGFSAGTKELDFSPLYNAPKTLLATMLYRVIADRAGGRTVLRVIKNWQSVVDEFPLPEDHDLPDQLHGLVYTRGDRSLAYSVKGGTWNVPSGGATGAGPVRTLTVGPHEVVLSAKQKDEGIWARLWSDARHGGDGTVRSIRQVDGTTSLRNGSLKLGSDAPSVVKIEAADDGLWALTVDDDGVPAELLRYHQNKREAKYQCTRFALADLRATAILIDPEASDA
ncbi:hypothetical protein [Allosphingosinicella deserti]|uniref:Uncharacterized protein n=1 Tax=Allosphingosinicella deserti TaxID=2116704 RepID=A0A2P7QKJ7_9SPHN|nr:hypothetical protein [Sphingomonas deserti]PSJ38509.1 hypothetical protein C7I55_18955 [Sphingomonas deserti]